MLHGIPIKMLYKITPKGGYSLFGYFFQYSLSYSIIMYLNISSDNCSKTIIVQGIQFPDLLPQVGGNFLPEPRVGGNNCLIIG